MPQVVTNLFTQAEPQAAGTPVRSAGEAGITAIKHPGQIFRGYADTGVADAQNRRFFQINGDKKVRIAKTTGDVID